MPTRAQDISFRDTLIQTNLLDEAIAWIKDNLSPDEVFTTEDLEKWAEERGYMKEE